MEEITFAAANLGGRGQAKGRASVAEVGGAGKRGIAEAVRLVR